MTTIYDIENRRCHVCGKRAKCTCILCDADLCNRCASVKVQRLSDCQLCGPAECTNVKWSGYKKLEAKNKKLREALHKAAHTLLKLSSDTGTDTDTVLQAYILAEEAALGHNVAVVRFPTGYLNRLKGKQ